MHTQIIDDVDPAEIVHNRGRGLSIIMFGVVAIPFFIGSLVTTLFEVSSGDVTVDFRLFQTCVSGSIPKKDNATITTGCTTPHYDCSDLTQHMNTIIAGHFVACLRDVFDTHPHLVFKPVETRYVVRNDYDHLATAVKELAAKEEEYGRALLIDGPPHCGKTCSLEDLLRRMLTTENPFTTILCLTVEKSVLFTRSGQRKDWTAFCCKHSDTRKELLKLPEPTLQNVLVLHDSGDAAQGILPFNSFLCGILFQWHTTVVFAASQQSNSISTFESAYPDYNRYTLEQLTPSEFDELCNVVGKNSKAIEHPWNDSSLFSAVCPQHPSPRTTDVLLSELDEILHCFCDKSGEQERN